MSIIGINQVGIPKYQLGTGENGIQLNYEGPTYQQMMDQMKQDYPFEYNQMQIKNAKKKSPSSEIVTYVDADGNMKTAQNPAAGALSGTDPIARDIVMGTVVGKPLTVAGKAVYKALKPDKYTKLARVINNHVDIYSGNKPDIGHYKSRLPILKENFDRAVQNLDNINTMQAEGMLRNGRLIHQRDIPIGNTLKSRQKKFWGGSHYDREAGLNKIWWREGFPFYEGQPYNVVSIKSGKIGETRVPSHFDDAVRVSNDNIDLLRPDLDAKILYTDPTTGLLIRSDHQVLFK